MRKLSYTITAENGLDAPNAEKLVKELIGYSSLLKIFKERKDGDPRFIFNLLALSIKKGDEVVFTLEGGEEEAEAKKLESYLSQYL